MPDFKLKILKYVAFISLTFFYWETMAQDKSGSLNQKKVSIVPEAHMQKIFEEIKTPFKYGVVFKHQDSTKLMDSPTIFREDGMWFMSYIVFDGKGYETWMAKSVDLLHWESIGKILSFTQNTWDANQKAGYMALVNINWGGNYSREKYKNRFWMSYLGGNTQGYEAGVLGVGMAYDSTSKLSKEWKTLPKPILQSIDANANWFDNKTIYKSLVFRDEKRLTSHPFVMFYNAKGDTANYESIGMAVSDDMLSWKRFGQQPVLTKFKGISGDAQITKIGNLYVMFYFGAFWKPGAFERFACSYDLIHWTDWKGEDLIASSTDYDEKYAHKPWVIKWKGTVYHFYTAVGKSGRVIALATSKDLSK